MKRTKNKTKKKTMRIFCLLLCLCMAVLGSSCSGEEPTQTQSAAQTQAETAADTGNSPITEYSMDYLDTFIQISLYDTEDRSILHHCFEIIESYEDRLSRTLPGTEIYELNETGSVEVEDDVRELLEYGLYYSGLTDGVFDITVEPVTSLWDFKAENPTLPDPDVLAEAVKHVDYTKLHLDGNTVTLEDPESGVDLGAIAKGFIADQVKEYLVSEGVESAIINLGGNVLCVGHKPDGTSFNVGLQYPFGARDDLIAVVEIDDFSVVTSGIDQRNFTIDGVLYHHILDTETGYPVDNNLLSVTIISEKSVDGDGLSTTCFALGLEKGMELINSIDGVYAAFVTDDYQIHYSEGFEDHIQVTDNQ